MSVILSRGIKVIIKKNMQFIRYTYARLIKSRRYYTPYYRHVLKKYIDFSIYYKVFNSIKFSDEKTNTNVKISFTQNLSFGNSLNNIKDRFNGSFRVVKQLEGLKILLSEIKISQYRFILEMHFFNDQLVFFKYIFRNLEHKKVLLDMIREKYLKNSKIILKNKSLSIEDNNHNFIYIENEVDLSISYLSFNFGFYDHLIKEKEEKEVLILRNKEEVLDKLYKTL